MPASRDGSAPVLPGSGPASRAAAAFQVCQSASVSLAAAAPAGCPLACKATRRDGLFSDCGKGKQRLSLAVVAGEKKDFT